MAASKVNWSIDGHRTALIVVDMQQVFCESDGALFVAATSDIVGNIASVIDKCRQHGLPVIYLRHVVRGDGSDTGRMRDMYPNVDTILARDATQVAIIDALKPAQQDIVVDKLFYSGFHNTDLDTILRVRDINTLIVCGTVTNVCCDTTIRDAVHREYKVIALADACAAMDYPDMGFGTVSAAQVQRVTLTTIAYEFGEVTSTADVIKRISASQHGESEHVT